MKTMLYGLLLIVITVLIGLVGFSVMYGIGFVIEWLTGFDKALTVLIEMGIILLCGFSYLVGVVVTK